MSSPNKPQEFLALAISDFWHLLRAAILLFVATAGLVAAIWSVATYIVPKIGGIKIAFSNGVPVVTINGNTQWRSLLVPAVQLFVDTKVTLEEGGHYKINATGLVSTAPSDAQYALDLFGKLEPEYKYLLKRDFSDEALKAKFSREHKITWRNPDGESFYAEENLSTTEDSGKKKSCESARIVEEASKQLTLLPEEQWGVLIGILTKGQDPIFRRNKEGSRELDTKDMAIFCLGANAEIMQTNGKFIVKSPGCHRRPFPLIDTNAYGYNRLFLSINDTVLTRAADFRLVPDCPINKTPEKNQKEFQKLLAWRSFYQAMFASPNKKLSAVKGRPALWYHDNDGYFTVNILTTLSTSE